MPGTKRCGARSILPVSLAGCCVDIGLAPAELQESIRSNHIPYNNASILSSEELVDALSMPQSIEACSVSIIENSIL